MHFLLAAANAFYLLDRNYYPADDIADPSTCTLRARASRTCSSLFDATRSTYHCISESYLIDGSSAAITVEP